jgi:predicted  nucleic acid-binding Zn-ribbon protein
MNDAYAKAAGSAEVKAAHEARVAAEKAASDAYAASQAPKLEQARRAAQSAHEAKLRELCDKDAAYAALSKQIADLAAQAKDVEKKMREAKARPAPAAKDK